MIGIYKITNDITGKVYIGQSVNIFRRWKQHQEHCLHYELSKEDWHIDLYNNPQNYSFKVIEVCQKEELDTKEIYWIDYYNSFNDGLNKTSGGRHCEQFNKVINKPYIMEDGTVICPQEYLDTPLTKEMKKELCNIIDLRNKDKRKTGWTTLKKGLNESGYSVKDIRKTVDGIKKSFSIITKVN